MRYNSEQHVAYFQFKHYMYYAFGYNQPFVLAVSNWNLPDFVWFSLGGLGSL